MKKFVFMPDDRNRKRFFIATREHWAKRGCIDSSLNLSEIPLPPGFSVSGESQITYKGRGNPAEILEGNDFIRVDHLRQALPTIEIPGEVLFDFREGFQEESYLIAAIKKYLLTPEQKKILDSRGISLEDYLNGRIEGEDQDEIYDSFAKDWNEKLGFMGFGDD